MNPGRWRGAVATLLVGLVGLVGLTLPAAPPAGADPGAFDLQAHRGGRGETTEESLPAFAHALQVGVDTLELDVVLTADDRPLVWHDPVIEATKCRDTAPAVPADPQFPYVGRAVAELTLSQLRTLDCGLPQAQFPQARVIAPNRLATLPEVFALAEGYRAAVRFNIETKVSPDDPAGAPQASVAAILAAVRAAGVGDRVSIQSFDWRTLPLVRAADPAIPLVALWEPQTWRPGSPWLAGIDPAAVPDPLAAVNLLGAEVAAPPYQLVDADFVARAHRLGLTVVPWTVNDPAALHTLIDAGVDGVITDYPTMARGVLAERGMPLPRPYGQ